MFRISTLLLLVIGLQVQGQNTSYDTTFNFSSTPSFLVDSLTTGQWQIGTPSKPYFTSAQSAPYALVTDTLNQYDTSTRSEVYFRIDPSIVGMGMGLGIEFDHKYQTTTDLDGGWIEMKISDSGCWMNMLEPQWHDYPWIDSCAGSWGDYVFTSWYTMPHNDTLSDGTYAYHGTQDWSNDYVGIWWTVPVRSNPPPIWIRFVFRADANLESLDGWMIDNLKFQMEWASGLDEHSDARLEIHPNPASDELQVTSLQKANAISILDQSGRLVMKQRFNGTVDVSSLPEGMYLMQVVLEGGGVAHERFVVSR